MYLKHEHSEKDDVYSEILVFKTDKFLKAGAPQLRRDYFSIAVLRISGIRLRETKGGRL